MKARISVITLGVADVPRARAFYQALGWPLSGEPEDRVACFRNAGSKLALYALDGIADEAGQTPAPPGSMRVTLAMNVEAKEAVDAPSTVTPGRSPTTPSGRSTRTGCRYCPERRGRPARRPRSPQRCSSDAATS